MTEPDNGLGFSQPFMEHLVELRKRLMLSIYGVVVGFSISYYFSERVFDLLLQPLCSAFKKPTCPIVFTSLVEPFLVYLKAGMLGGLFLSVPWIFYQVWQFIKPGLKADEKKYVVPFVSVASVMFIFGACLGYFFLFPIAFEFFLSIVPETISPMLSMSDYFSLASGLLIAFGILFEIPVFVVLLNMIGVLPAKTLWKTWRMTVAGIFILAAVLTPADPYTMLLLGVPLSVLYILALIVCSLLEKARS